MMDWWDYTRILLFITCLILILWRLNLPQRLRYRQYKFPLFAGIGSVAILILFLYFFPVVEFLFDQVIKQIPDNQISNVNPAMQINGLWFFLLNLIILLAFMAIKLCLQLVTLLFIGLQKALLWLRTRFGNVDAAHRLFASGQPKVRFIYENRAGGVSLKNGWEYPAAFFRWCSAPAILLFLVMMWVFLHMRGDDVPPYLMYLPVLPLIVTLEIAWYLSGPRLKDPDGDFTCDETDSRILGTCSDLMAEYHQLWPDQVLASALLEAGKSKASGSEELIVQDVELEQIKKNLAQAGTELGVRQFEVLRQMWAGRDLLLASYRLEEIAPCLFACLQRDLEEGCRIVFLVDTRRRSAHLHNEVRQWIDQWMRRPIFAGRSCRIASIDQFLRNEEILITSVGELLDLGINNFSEWFCRVRTIVVLNIPEVIFPDILSANALFQIISDQSDHAIQKVMLATDKRKNMEDTARSYLAAKTIESDFFDGMIPTQESCYTIWRSEGEQPYQQRIGLGGESNMGVEIALATPALNDGIRPIHLAGLAELPWREYLESLDNMQFRVDLSVNLQEALRYHTRPYIQKQEERVFYIARDDIFNLLVTLQRFLALGQRGAFVHVVCPPYLLRDYFVDNLDFFMDTEPLRALAPLLTHSRSTILYYLLERMVSKALTEEKIRHHLEWGLGEETNRHDAIETLLDDLFNQVFGLSLHQTGFLKVNTQWRFYGDTARFEKIVTYRLSPEIKQHLKTFIGDYYRIFYEKEGVVDTISENHLYQKYLPDQIHAFMGQPAEIKKSSSHRKSIYTEHRSPEGDVIYRPVDIVQIHSATPSFELPAATKGHYSLRRKTYEVDLSFRTEGFFTFRFGIDLDDALDYKGLDKHESPKRRHSHGRLLVVEVCRINGDCKIENAARLSNTLALLMNELRVSLFPETYPYIKITTPHHRDDDACPAAKLVPRLDADLGGASALAWADHSDSVCIYIMEDSQKDMGLVRAVKENLIYILEILQDYIAWDLEKEADEKRYLNFGMSSPPPWLAMEPALELVSSLLKGYPNTLHKRRQYFVQSEAGNQLKTLSKRMCDFCGSQLSGSMYEQLKDGRERCHLCRDNAVQGAGGYEKLLDEGRRWLLKTYKADITKSIQVKVTGTKIIQDMIQYTFVPTSRFDPRAVGLAVTDSDGYAIFVENNHRFDITLATFVHELTHIWQYENLNYIKMERDHGPLLTEGHAVHTAITCMKSKGLAGKYCQAESSRKDAYGQGYQLVSQLLEKYPSDNPFDMLKQMYPGR